METQLWKGMERDYRSPVDISIKLFLKTVFDLSRVCVFVCVCRPEDNLLFHYMGSKD